MCHAGTEPPCYIHRYVNPYVYVAMGTVMSNALTMLRDKARLMRRTDEHKALEEALVVNLQKLENEYNCKRQELINQFYKDAEQLTLTPMVNE